MKRLLTQTRIYKLMALMVMALLFSCENDNSPGVEYMPDMYRSPAIEPFVDYVYVDSMTSRLPPVGSIPRGFIPFPFENTLEGHEKAGELLKNPYTVNDKFLKDGQVLFSRFCAHCHGEKGDGAGTITNPIYGAVPSYASDIPNRRGGRAMKDLNDGHIYHTIMYGLNAMGPHATLIREKDRWKIVAYVHTLQGNDAPAEEGEKPVVEEGSENSNTVSDSTATNS